MDYQARRKQILVEMARIDSMEKGRVTEEHRESRRDGKTVRLGPYYKHQRWENGRNISRRVPKREVEALREAADGYHRFQSLAAEFVQITVAMTRAKTADDSKKKPG